MRRLLLPAALLAIAGCATTQTYVAPERRAEPAPALPAGDVAHQIFLTGNTGDFETDAVLRAVGEAARQAGDDATVVVLGDVTAAGIPAAGAPGRAEAERPVRALIDALAGVAGDVVVVPGDRDWAEGEDGVKRLETLLDDAFDADVLTPGDQSGGPREAELAEGLRLVAFDSAWWLLDADDRPEGEAEDQDVRTPGDVARILEQIVRDRDDSRIVVVAHHPLVSRGAYAGYRSNPLSSVLSRTFGLGRQDLAAPDYRQMRSVLGRVLDLHDEIVYAAAHDRILLTVEEEASTLHTDYALVSGTGGGRAGALGGGDALHGAARPGFQRLVYYSDGRLWQETVEVDLASGAPRVVFRTEISGPNREMVDPEAPDVVAAADLPDNLGGTVTMASDADFVTSRFKNDGFTRAFFGENYRDAWRTEITVPVLDMGAAAGGLEPVKKGGGLQTTSLRLLGADGHEYGLRLLEKSGLAQVPYELRDGLVGDIVLELRAAMAPWAALVASPLARAAGVAQPDPQIVYVPDDPRLGRYRELFADRLALFEIRPDDDMSDVPGFEGMTDVGSAANLREDLREDQDHRVDQRAYVEARLFDMLLNDWDRHADQWRWAAYEPVELDPSLTGDEATRGKVYRPIARDRDFALYGIGGLFQPVLQIFDERLQPTRRSFDSIRGLTHNGFVQDRRFLNELTREDWEAAVAAIQARLPDAVIEDAVRQTPAAIQPLVAADWAAALKSRRDRLGEAALAYYDIQANVVDVLGSDEREAFEVERQRGGALRVTVRSFKGGEPGAQLYQRTFQPDETSEVRLYGLAGRDRFAVTGDGPARIQVRVIAGAGDDELVAPAGDVIVYDTPDGLTIADGSRGVSDRRSDDPDVNRYDAREQVLGNTMRAPVVGYQATDGFLIGAQQTWLVPGFRLHPFAATHTVAVNYATTTGGFAGSYSGYMREAIGALDLEVDASASTPRYARNFYGLGNGSPDLPGEFARVDLARVQARAGLGAPIGEGVRFVAGPMARYADARRDSLGTPPSGGPVPATALPDASYDGQAHAGGFARLALETTDRPVNPRQGLQLSLDGSVQAGVSGEAETYGTAGAEAALYVPLGISPQVTVALRAGGAHRFGDFPFFDAAVLGGPGTLRGYRRERFAGRSAASASAELRAKVLDLDAYVLPLEIGVLGFADAGRVWADAPADLPPLAAVTFPGDDLQLGYGGGLWMSALDRAVVTLTVGASDEATLVTFGLGFAY